jgi:hypothetical protein
MPWTYRSLRVLALISPLSLSALHGQEPAIDMHGSVRDAHGPVAYANVFVLGTLDGAITDSGGYFGFRTLRRTQYLIVVRHEGHRELRTVVTDSASANVALTLEESGAEMLGTVTVEAGRYVAADAPGAILTPLEIVTIPGAAANVNRAIQTLPGVAQVDEGTGLFVRGGDYTETRVFLNEGLLLNPAQLQRPAGTFVGSLDPFLMDAVYFTAGGFGARYGDALSGVVALRTQARPTALAATLSVGLAALGADVALPGPRGTGLRLVANRNDLAPVLWLNGSPRQFSTAPHGADLTMSAFWNYRPTAQITLFATQQDETLGLLDETPSVSDTSADVRRDRAIVLSWSDLLGRVEPTVSLSSSMVHDNQRFGAFELSSPQRLDQGTSIVQMALDESVTLRGGVEASRMTSGVAGSVPATGADERLGARVRLYDLTRAATRAGAFTEIDFRPTAGARLVVGLRTDRASNGLRATLDPRLSGAWRVTPLITLTSAWGVYHQAPDPVLAILRADAAADASLPAMRATQAMVGVQLGDSGAMLRAEAYHKQYASLVQQTRDFLTVTGGTGRAQGIDVIARPPPLGGLSSRIVYSLLDATRTDPSSGVLARAPFDVTHSLALIATQLFPRQLMVGAALRYASGRPFTPVVSAVQATGVSPTWTPVYGAPESLRLPAYARLDFSANWLHAVGAGVQAVAYLTITNALARPNVYDWRYSSDYTVRHNVASIFNRSVYFGGVFTFTKRQ